MKKYIVKKHQSLVDIAVQLYGNVDALPELLELNPVVFGTGGEYEIGPEVEEGTEIFYDDTSILYNKLAVEVRNEEVLATASGHVFVLELPEPGYEFHPRTLDFFDGIADVPGGPWENYFSLNEAKRLDRFVRDLNGEANGGYPTVDIWSKFVAIFPVMGTDNEVHSKNLIQPHANMAFSATGVTHQLNAISMDGITGSGDTLVVDGVNTNQANMCMGLVFSNFVHNGSYGSPNTFMGAFQTGNFLFLRTFYTNYDAMITTTSGGFGSAIPYEADDFLHLQSNTAEQALYQGGNNIKIAHKAFVTGTSSGADILIGSGGASHAQADYHLAYIGQSLDDDERKSLMNSINYFMYKKGVRASFTEII